jgi:hypothetical protein
METKDIIELAFKLVGLVNTFWAAYATVTVALLGWLFSGKGDWPWPQKLAIAVAYGLIVGINCAAHYRINGLLSAVIKELHNRPDLPEGLRLALSRVKPPPALILMMIHLVVSAAVIFLILFQQHILKP